MSVRVENKKIRVSQKSKTKINIYCKWCGKPFKKHHNRQMYCSDEHRKYALQNHKRDHVRKKRKSISIIKDDSYYGLGSGFLSTHRREDFKEESTCVIKEIKRLGIR